MHKDNIQSLLHRKWYRQGLNANPAFIHAAEESGIKYMKKNFGFGYTDFLHIFKDGYDEIHYDMADLEFLAGKVINSYFKDKRHLKKLTAFWKKDRKDFYDYLDFFLTKKNYISKLSTDGLIREYKKASQAFYNIFATSHLIEPVSLTTDAKLKDRIKDQIPEKLQKNFNQFFSILTQQIFSSYLNDYNLEIKKLADIAANNRALHALFQNGTMQEIKNLLQNNLTAKKLFTKHLKKYFWINSTWQAGTNYTLDDLIMILQRVIRGEDNLNPYNKIYFQNNLNAKNKLIKKLKLDIGTERLIRLLDFAARWQDDRKREMITGTWMLDKFLGELAKRFCRDQQDLRYLLPEEVSKKRLQSKNLDKELAARRKLSVYLFYKKEYEIITGKKAEEFIGKLKNKDKRGEQSLNGISASLGKVSGKAKICLTIKDIQNFQEGEILITTMTRPEFVPAMKKALAIVTDEGGLTCHAAIISRELKKPCLIATKFATQIFKDGDWVEVNANHGWVKFL